MPKDETLDKVEYLLSQYSKKGITVDPLMEHLIKTIAIDLDYLNTKVLALNSDIKFIASQLNNTPIKGEI